MTRPASITLIAAMMGSALPLGGCIGYTTYPPANGQLASDDINGPPADELMIEALRWTIERHPPEGGGAAVINLPEGVHDRAYRIIEYRLDDATATPVRAMAPGLEGSPTYHVVRLWVRADRAEVDVLRPVSELGPSPSGDPIIQAVTIHLRGGLREWRVERTRPWVIGTDALPEPHYVGVAEADGAAPEDEAAGG